MVNGETRIHETDFCAQVAAAAEIFFANTDSPFRAASIEGFGTGASKLKRKDLRFFDRNTGRIAICGEVRLPGPGKGRSAYDMDLVQNASQKAEDAGAQFFFTWDVNVFVLWDRSRWREPLLERRVREWPLKLHFLHDANEVGKPENLDFIKTKFMPGLLLDLARIYRGENEDWPMPPDDIFLRSLERHLSIPIELTRAHLAERSISNRPFKMRLQEWMLDQDWYVPANDSERWAEALDRAAKTLAHVLANRLIFYRALKARFPSLPPLKLKGAKNAEQAYASLQRLFEKAVHTSGDYEPLFSPNEQDWAGKLLFEGHGSIEAWQVALHGIEAYDFNEIASDVIGKVFQRLVSPEERHRWGQHFTGDDPVDLINSFCVHTAEATVLDPACGSGSFLVRAYYRKRWLDPQKSHAEVLGQLFGCDISLYPAHLATLNLAAREITEEANYPRITRRDFFDVDPLEGFCEIPPDHTKIELPRLNAVVGNPPYVRQERIDPKEKRKLIEVVSQRFFGLRFSGRTDLHCYFWPAASAMLAEGGYFGFLTSSSWLDVEYGFLLQKWILENFKLVAVMESDAEPWFEDARVKTCATILQRCSNANERMSTSVKFVKFKRPLAQIIGVAPEQADLRFPAVDSLRDLIQGTMTDFEDPRMRVIVKRQKDLWEEGVRARRVLTKSSATEPTPEDHDDGSADDNGDQANESGAWQLGGNSEYVAGKWGRYLRAPDIYFEIMRNYGAHFVRLGEIAGIRFGVKTGCDAFFMPRDISNEALEQFIKPRDFKREFGADREEVSAGRVKIARAGDGSKFPIEAEYLWPEVHSLMTIDRPIVRSADIDRVVLMVGKKEDELKGTHVARYLRHGKTANFASSKSKGVPVPQRSTCAARSLWYNLTGLVRPGVAFWPMAQQYRHVVAANPEQLVCNHNLFDISADQMDDDGQRVLVAVLNSTIVALWKTFYGRYAGTEGNLKTEVVDVNLLEVPDPRAASPAIARRIVAAFDRLIHRPSGRLVEEQLMDCHSPERANVIASEPLVLSEELLQSDRRELDDAVFELLGVTEASRRVQLVDRLHLATAEHFRRIRVVEIQKMEQRAKSKNTRVTVAEFASDVWNAATFRNNDPLKRWIALWPEPRVTFRIPAEGEPRLVAENSMFDRETVFFGTDKSARRAVCSSRAQAELVARLAQLEFRGEIETPDAASKCSEVLNELNHRFAEAQSEFETIASSRVPDEKTRDEILQLLNLWFLHGKPGPHQKDLAYSGEEELSVAAAVPTAE